MGGFQTDPLAMMLALSQQGQGQPQQPPMLPPQMQPRPQQPQQQVQQPTLTSQRPGIRMLLGNFLADFGAGLTSGSQARAGAQIAGGMGGALMAPQERAFRQAQAEFYRGRGEAAGVTAQARQTSAL